jgi:predicted amidohydrolase
MKREEEKEMPGVEPYARRPLPNYETVPLRSEEITAAAFQMTTKRVDAKAPAPVIRENLERAGWLIDVAQRQGRIDLCVFPEFTLQGSASAYWTRQDVLKLAIEVPSPETEYLGKKAKQYNCYIALSSYTRQKDWPDHFFNASILIGPSGEVLSHHWKAHFDPGLLEQATTVHDVLDEFVARYGWDRVWPVVRTDIGNIAHYTCSEGFAPETARVYAFKGAEIICWSLTGGGGREDAKAHGMIYFSRNDVYGIMADAAQKPANDYMYEGAGCGLSYIFANNGVVLAQSVFPHEIVVRATIPIGSFRRKHSIPVLRKEIYAPCYQQYEGKYPPNLYSKYLPADPVDGINYARKNARW